MNNKRIIQLFSITLVISMTSVLTIYSSNASDTKHQAASGEFQQLHRAARQEEAKQQEELAKIIAIPGLPHLIMEYARQPIEGNLFIEPSSRIQRAGDHDIRRYKQQLGITLKKGDLLIEVFAQSPGSFKQWADNSYAALCLNATQINPYTFPTHLPYSLLKGRKEDNTLFLTIAERPICLRMQQKAFKYFTITGNFETALARLTQMTD